MPLFDPRLSQTPVFPLTDDAEEVARSISGPQPASSWSGHSPGNDDDFDDVNGEV